MHQPEISVVICTCNRASMIERAIESVLHQQTGGFFSYEVLVIDDGSTDHTREVVQRLIKASPSDDLRYLFKNGEGVAAARNYGVNEARGKWIAFFDDDQIADENWLASLYQVAREKRAHCVGGSLSLLLPDNFSLELGPKARRVLGERNFGNEIRMYVGEDVPGTGNVLFHKKLFVEHNGFATAMREGAEDTDFFHRIQQAGYEIWYAPEAHGYHVIPESRANLNFIRWVTTKGGVAWARLQYRHYGLKRVLLTSISRACISLLRDLPLMLWALLSQDQALRIECVCTMRFSLGYLRGSLHFLSPKFFKQQNFMTLVDFRSHGGERKEIDPATNV